MEETMEESGDHGGEEDLRTCSTQYDLYYFFAHRCVFTHL